LVTDFGTLGLFIVIAFIFPLLLIGLPLILRYSGAIPKHPNRTKQDVYECGMKPFRGAWAQINFHYYVFAILFVVLDVMSVFIFPWAARFIGLETNTDQTWGIITVAVFVGILLVGLAYAWKKKALEWK